MTAAGSVTRWIDELREGDSAAAEALWQAYFARMVALARAKLGRDAGGAADEEDVALSAFYSFCAGVERGRFPRLCDRTNLWSLLMAITAHKSVDYLRRQGRQKRRPSGAIKRLDSEPRASGLLHLISREPEPGFALAIADELEQQLQSLDATGDADLRQIATFRLEGLSQKDIAARLGCVPRTVARKLQLIERLWLRGLES